MNAREYMARVHELPCVVHHFKTNERRRCDEAHHVLPGDDFSTVPLCDDCHQGARGVHGMHRRPFYVLWNIPGDAWLIARTAELIAKGIVCRA